MNLLSRFNSYHACKRIFDFLVSFFLLILFSPIIILVALVAVLFIGSPVLFVQQRPGWKEKPFYLIKFRTMTNALSSSGVQLPDSERLTRTGNLFRRLSLDELPQLINVIKGDMSLVGPRPLLMEYLPLYSHRQARRHDVRPGITGWAQVNGRNAIDWETRLEMDVWYVDHASFLLDMKILIATIKKVLNRQGVSAPGHATVAKFKGQRAPDNAYNGSDHQDGQIK